jgi:uncharacterized membrane protein required for colicin V production
MNGIDFISIVFLISGIFAGTIRGFIGGIIDIIGIIGGVSLASVAYKAPVNLFARFNIKGTPVDILFFHLFSFLFIISAIVGIEIFRRKVFIKHIVDRIFGLFTGAICGMFFCCFLLNMISASPNGAKEIESGKFAKRITRFVPGIYERADKIGITLPKLIALPKEYRDEFDKTKLTISFLKVNYFKTNETYTCIKCGGKVKFSGYVIKAGMSITPKFTCEKCGANSCGCLTYEIFHSRYKQCPIVLTKQGMWFYCGYFPNYELAMPKGQCPVCKNQLQEWEWKPPVSYKP